MLKNLVVYASETGNTKKLAQEIYNALPNSMGKKELVNIRKWNGSLDAENYYIGFWVNRGSCSLEILDLLSSLHDRNVALFGTCGMGDTKEYFKSLEQNAKVWLSEDNYFMGSYFCLGKMPLEIRMKYESYRGKCPDSKIDMMLAHFDKAMSHPDMHDLMKARMFVESCIEKAEKEYFINAYV